MSVSKFEAVQRMPIPVSQAWEFFSQPNNLKKITPEHLDFIVTSDLGDGHMYNGMIITYKVRPLLGIQTTWVTEIKNVKEGEYFIDEQRVGPYKMWHHQHTFKAIQGGTEMKDTVHYIVPFGILGRLAKWLIVDRELKKIFAYRFKVVEELFGKY